MKMINIHNIIIFIPLNMQHMKESYLKGILRKSPLDNSITVYFTTQIFTPNCIEDSNNCILGCYNKNRPRNVDRVIKQYPNYLMFKNNVHNIEKLIINNMPVDIKKAGNIVIMYYDYNAMKNSEKLTISSTYEDTFSELHKIIQREQEIEGPIDHQNYIPIFQSPYWLSSTMFGQHLLNYVELMYWLLSSIWIEKKVCIKHGNLLLAIITDLLLGYLILQILSQDKEYLSSQLMGVLEKLVNSLFSLLRWLMGAPAGLKLNNAFNKMLGKFFSYHVQLWWFFLDVAGQKLTVILESYNYLGYLGFTFQAAMISDMICIATFHSYCIYVYAARLFNIQISGLIALMRLFVGRKYNPLRNIIDSCEYTNQELFVGTVAFTILLFLLPTTAMYYIVFTLFRLLSLTMQFFLTKIIYFIQTLPLYVTLLWLIGSPKVAGNVRIKVLNKDLQPLHLQIELYKKSLGDLLKSSKPPVEAQKSVKWTNLVSKLLTGKTDYIV